MMMMMGWTRCTDTTCLRRQYSWKRGACCNETRVLSDKHQDCFSPRATLSLERHRMPLDTGLIFNLASQSNKINTRG